MAVGDATGVLSLIPNGLGKHRCFLSRLEQIDFPVAHLPCARMIERAADYREVAVSGYQVFLMMARPSLSRGPLEFTQLAFHFAPVPDSRRSIPFPVRFPNGYTLPLGCSSPVFLRAALPAVLLSGQRTVSVAFFLVIAGV